MCQNHRPLRATRLNWEGQITFFPKESPTKYPTPSRRFWGLICLEASLACLFLEGPHKMVFGFPLKGEGYPQKSTPILGPQTLTGPMKQQKGLAPRLAPGCNSARRPYSCARTEGDTSIERPSKTSSRSQGQTMGTCQSREAVQEWLRVPFRFPLKPRSKGYRQKRATPEVRK